MSNLDPAPVVPNIAAQLADHHAREASLRAPNKAALFAALAARGVSQVVVSYDGASDEGQIHDVEAKAGDATVPLPAVTVPCATAVWDQPEPAFRDTPVAEMIERIVYDLLETTHGGWEIGDGAHGEFVFDVTAGTITLDHNERYVATEAYSHRF